VVIRSAGVALGEGLTGGNAATTRLKDTCRTLEGFTKGA